MSVFRLIGNFLAQRKSVISRQIGRFRVVRLFGPEASGVL
jgi:hypothetical protein